MSSAFIGDDGTVSRSNPRTFVASTRSESARLIAQEWLRWTRVIPPQFAVGTALHETNYTLNEEDTDTSSSGNTITTYGLFQLSSDDKIRRARAPDGSAR